MEGDKIEKLMQTCHDVSSVHMLFKDGHLVVNNTYIQPVSYISFKELGIQYMTAKKNLLRKILDIQSLVISNVSPSKQIKQEYEAYVKEVSDLEDKLNELYITYAATNANERYMEVLKEVQQLKSKQQHIVETESEYDKKASKKLAKITQRLLELNTELKGIRGVSKQDYLKLKDAKILSKVVKKPTPSASPAKEEKKTQAKTKPKANTKTKANEKDALIGKEEKVKKPEKAPKTLVKTKLDLTKDDKEVIKKNVKDLIKSTFAFKTSDECMSKKRSQPYYETKDTIVEKISNSEELKNLMPGNYKSLTKEKICDRLFS